MCVPPPWVCRESTRSSSQGVSYLITRIYNQNACRVRIINIPKKGGWARKTVLRFLLLFCFVLFCFVLFCFVLFFGPPSCALFDLRTMTACSGRGGKRVQKATNSCGEAVLKSFIYPYTAICGERFICAFAHRNRDLFVYTGGDTPENARATVGENCATIAPR